MPLPKIRMVLKLQDTSEYEAIGDSMEADTASVLPDLQRLLFEVLGQVSRYPFCCCNYI